jgi:hypothetical protein
MRLVMCRFENLRQHNYLIETKDFADKVMLTVLEKKEQDTLTTHIADWTSGLADITYVRELYVDLEVPNL